MISCAGSRGDTRSEGEGPQPLESARRLHPTRGVVKAWGRFYLRPSKVFTSPLISAMSPWMFRKRSSNRSHFASSPPSLSSCLSQRCGFGSKPFFSARYSFTFLHPKYMPDVMAVTPTTMSTTMFPDSAILPPLPSLFQKPIGHARRRNAQGYLRNNLVHPDAPF